MWFLLQNRSHGSTNIFLKIAIRLFAHADSLIRTSKNF